MDPPSVLPPLMDTSLLDNSGFNNVSLLRESQETAWAGLRMRVRQLMSGQVRNIQGEHALLSMCLKGRSWGPLSSRGEVCEKIRMPNHINLYGPVLDIRSANWGCEPGTENMTIELDLAELERGGDLGVMRPQRRELRQALGLRDSHLVSLLHLMTGELRAGSPHGPLYATSLSIALAAYLFEHHGSGGRPASRERAGLTPAQKARVLDLVHHRLADKLTLEEMAATVGVSRFHFLRLFKNSFGTTPHRFVLDQRIAAARLLLESTKAPLADIATATGFSDQGHLCRVMRRHLGVSPGEWRRHKA